VIPAALLLRAALGLAATLAAALAAARWIG
jgi:hypothetical protein